MIKEGEIKVNNQIIESPLVGFLVQKISTIKFENY